MNLLEDSYRLLGLHPGAGPDRVRRAFRRAAGKCHPDLAPTTGSDEFIQLRKAFRLALGYEEGGAGGYSGKGPEDGSDSGDLADKDRVGPGPGANDLDIRLSLSLDLAGAIRGTETVLSYTRRVPCRACKAACPGCRGKGWVLVQGGGMADLIRERCPLCQRRPVTSCPICQGRGFQEEEARTPVLIPPHLDGSEILVLPGMGHQVPDHKGDLILSLILDQGDG